MRVFQRRFIWSVSAFKQLAMIFMSILAGNMYESIGFQALTGVGSGGAGLHLTSCSRLAAPAHFLRCVASE
nr:MFS transporter [Klebsiella pneumoniae]